MAGGSGQAGADPVDGCLGLGGQQGDQVEVLLDGGVRRGGDVVKALALGARAVMIGRAYLWGLAANGQAGVENVLDLMRDGLGSALIGLGRESIAAPTSWATAVAITVSVSSGRCGPCCSVEPTGTASIAPAAASRCAWGQVRSPSAVTPVPRGRRRACG